jgi:hypothetical protein
MGFCFGSLEWFSYKLTVGDSRLAAEGYMLIFHGAR